MAIKPQLGEVIRDAIEAYLADTHTSLPGKIVSYNAALQQASVQPLIKRGWIDEEGNRQSDSLPVVNNVPIVFPGGGGFRITFPIQSGDTCLLVFSSGSLDTWLSKGGEVDPNDDRRHDLSDAIAIPGLRPFSSPLATAHAAMATVGSDAGVAQIHFNPAEVLIGGTGALPTHIAALHDATVTTLALALKVWVVATKTALGSMADFVDPARRKDAIAACAANAPEIALLGIGQNVAPLRKVFANESREPKRQRIFMRKLSAL